MKTEKMKSRERINRSLFIVFATNRGCSAQNGTGNCNALLKMAQSMESFVVDLFL